MRQIIEATCNDKNVSAVSMLSLFLEAMQKSHVMFTASGPNRGAGDDALNVIREMQSLANQYNNGKFPVSVLEATLLPLRSYEMLVRVNVQAGNEKFKSMHDHVSALILVIQNLVNEADRVGLVAKMNFDSPDFRKGFEPPDDKPAD